MFVCVCAHLLQTLVSYMCDRRRLRLLLACKIQTHIRRMSAHLLAQLSSAAVGDGDGIVQKLAGMAARARRVRAAALDFPHVWRAPALACCLAACRLEIACVHLPIRIVLCQESPHLVPTYHLLQYRRSLHAACQHVSGW